MLRSLGKVVRRRPKTTLLVLAVVVLAGAGVGLYLYALRQWQGAQVGLEGGRLGGGPESPDGCLLGWPPRTPLPRPAGRVAPQGGGLWGAGSHPQPRLQN